MKGILGGETIVIEATQEMESNLSVEERMPYVNLKANQFVDIIFQLLY